MLPTRTVAFALVAFLLAGALPNAEAQTTGSTDLVVGSLTVDKPIVNVTATVTVVVHNAGSRTFSGSFTVFVGYKNVTSDSDCLERGGSASATDPTAVTGQASPPCYVQFPNANIQPGQDATSSFRWTVQPSQAFDNHGSITIMTKIENGPCTNQGSCPSTPTGAGTLTGSGGTGPDDITDNNVHPWPLFVKTPKVRAFPERAGPAPITEGASTTVNDPWPAPQVTKACQDSPATTDYACIVQPGHAITSVYKVLNLGNAPDTFTPVIGYDSRTQPLFAGQGFQVSVSPPSKYIDAGGSADIKVTVVVPRTAPANTNANVGYGATPNLTVAWVSTTDPLVTSADSGLGGSSRQDCPSQLHDAGECQASTILPFVVGQSYGLNLTTDIKDNFTVVTSGQSTALDLIANNTGNAPDRYIVTLDRANSTIDDSWLRSDSIPPASDSVDAGAQRILTPYIVPPNATRGYYTVAFTLQSVTSDSDAAHVTFTLYLQQTYALSAELANQLQLVVPGDTASFLMTATNPGNGPENLTATVSNAPPGWSWSLSAPTFTVGPQSSATFYLNTTVPAGTAADTQGTFFLNVTSNDPQDKPQNRPAAQALTPKVTVLRGPNAELTIPTTTAFVDAGNATTYRIHVRNVGNVASNFTFDKDVSDSTWGASVDPAYLVLNPLNSGTPGPIEGDVTVTLRAPQGAAVGEVDRVTVTVTPSADPGRSKETVLQGRISGPDLYAQRIDLNTSTPYAGDPVTVTVRVGNQGNRAPATSTTLLLVAVKDGQSTPVANITIGPLDLRPGTTHDVVIPWDTTGLDGDVVLQATLDPANLVPEIDETNNAASRATTLRTANAIRLLPADALSGHAGEDVSYNQAPNVFQVQYTGNQANEPVVVQVLSAHGWVNVDDTPMTLPRGALLPIAVTVHLPALPGASSDLLTVRIVPTYRPTAVVTASVTTSIVDDAPPQIGLVTATPAVVTLGQNLTIDASVVDATGLSSVVANVITPENDVLALQLTPQADGTFAATQTWTVAGTYAVTIYAKDNAATPNVNDTHATLATFVVRAGSAPAIAMAPGQSTTVRSGTPVRLAISDPLGISKANYTMKGVTYDMGRNFSIDTTSLATGSYTVLVTAENLYHVPASATFNITIDNTPPGIRSVTLNPATPKAGQDTVVHVETDAKVTGVQILVKKDGAIVQTLDATKKSPGVFEVTLNPQVGSYSVDVTASDAAGNQKLSEGAVVFSAKAGSVIPGPELGLLALGVALVAIALRRRA